MWCRSRTKEEVAAQRAIIEKTAPKLAALLLEEFCELGPSASSHLPGQSWHQWGEAVDVYYVLGKKAEWTGSGQKLLSDLCSEIGIFHSYNEKSWRPRSRYWHVQLRRAETPLMLRGFVDSWAELEAAMTERFEL